MPPALTLHPAATRTRSGRSAPFPAARSLLALAALMSLAAGARAAEPPRGRPLTFSLAMTAPDSLARTSVTAFPTPQRRAWQAGLLRPDRLEHASLSFTLAAAVVLATRSRTAGAATALAFGLGKEHVDSHGASGFDPVDLVADASGIALALVAVRAH